jgi:plasmid stability protein
MTTVPISDGSANLSVNMPTEMRDQLKELAKRSGMSMGAYVRKILEDTLNSGLTYELVPRLQETPTSKPAPAVQPVTSYRKADQKKRKGLKISPDLDIPEP